VDNCEHRALDTEVLVPAPFRIRYAGKGQLALIRAQLAAFAPELVSHVSSLAPGAALRFVSVSGELSSMLSGSELSLALVPVRFAAEDMQSRAVGELRFGVAGRRGHPALSGRLSFERWVAEPHVVVSVGIDRSNVIDEELTRRGVQRRVGLVVPSFLAGLHSLKRSNLLMNVPIPLVDDAAKQLGLLVRKAPLSLPRLRFSLVWRARFQHDPAHFWLRQKVLERVQRAFITRPRTRSRAKRP